MRNIIITSAIAALSLISVVAQASELAVGYGVKLHQKFSLDAEVFFNHGLADDNQSLRLPEEYGESGFLTDQNLDADGNSYGVRIKPAYAMHSGLKFFMPVGLVNTHFDVDANLLDEALTAFPVLLANSQEGDNHMTGVEFGFGLEADLMKNASIALSASRTFYQENEFPAPDDIASDTVLVHQSYDNTMAVNKGNVSFIYRF